MRGQSMEEKFDAIVIGTGQAGPSVAARFSQEGLKVAIIERKLFGGTCVNVGCIPTKTLVASARAAFMVRRAGEFGVQIEGAVGLDMKRVKQRKDKIVAQSNKGVTEWLKGLKNVEIICGHAKFEGPRVVGVGDRRLSAEKVIINVGGRAFVPELPGLNQVKFLTNTGMLEVDFLPRHLVIIGGSYIGLEFAQMYRRFGSEVTVVEKGSRLLPREDEDVSQALFDVLSGEGVKFHLSAECIEVGPSKTNWEAEGVEVKLSCEDPVKKIKGSHLLLAVGRRPNTDDLGLDQADVKKDSRGFIEVDENLQTSTPGIWALGDVHSRGGFTHTSYNDYEILVANMFDDDPRQLSDRIPCYGLFVDPPLGRIGMSESQARDSGKNILVGKRMMSRVGRAREKSETHGFIKILVDGGTKEILGAAIFGLHGDEVVHSLLDIMYAKAPFTVIQRAVHIHPTVSELLPTVLGDLKPLKK